MPRARGQRQCWNRRREAPSRRTHDRASADRSSNAREPKLLRGLPHSPMIVRHRRVGQAEMGEGIVDGVEEGGDAPDIGRFTDPLGTDRVMRRGLVV
jgi:hypothetical protein